MRKIISLHIFWVVFPQWLPFSAFSLKGYPKRKIPQISTPSGSHHLMSNLPKSGHCCTELGWRSLFVSPSRSSCRHPNQEPQSHEKHFYPYLSHKKEFLKTPQRSLLVLPSPGEVPTHCQPLEETSGPGEKPPRPSQAI